METHIDRTKPVMVTGATGYVASWLVKKLLESGLTVHAPVRDPKNEQKVGPIRKLADGTDGKIVFFKADLLDQGSYEESMKGCELVFHTASPFVNVTKNPEKDLIKPALDGTKNVLESVNKTDTVKRVVLTSSTAAIYSDNIDVEKAPTGKLTENQWNTNSSVSHQPYYYSKTLAEQEAWKIAKAQDRWDLVVINPTLVIGPAINPKATSESLNLVKQLGDGSSKMGVPHFEMGVVDVRDVAEAHYRAGFFPKAEGRHIVSAKNSSMLALGQMLDKSFPERGTFPGKTLPKFLVWLGAPIAGYKRKMIAKNVGHPFKADNSKSKEALQLDYRPVDKAITEMFQQMIDEGQVK
jgi:dihydroflavonol-4-reductase